MTQLTISGFTCEANSDLLDHDVNHHQQPQQAMTSDAVNRKVNDSKASKLVELSVSSSIYKPPKLTEQVKTSS